MTELFLIAHKVRGEPALDVAQQMKACKRSFVFSAGASTIRRLAPAMSAREIQARLCYYSDQLEIGLRVKK
jgi:hypothetical protein